MAETLPTGTPPQVIALSACRLRKTPHRWTFAADHAAAIATHWQTAQAKNPSMFNGVIHLMLRGAIREGVLDGELLATDFRSLLYWKSRGYPEAGVRDAFGSAVVVSRDGHVLLGVQRSGHLNAGLAYCPGGFIDERDVGPDGTIDIVASTARELAEETGLDAAAFGTRPGYLLTMCGPLLSLGVVYRAQDDAETLAADVRRHIAADPDPELADVAIVRRGDNLARIPLVSYARVLLEAIFPPDASQSVLER